MNREEWLRQEVARYKKKVDTYLAMIAEWESELGITSQATPQAQAPEITNHKKSSGTGDPLSVIQGMVFFNKSQPEAAKALLEMVGYPLTTAQIMEGIERGGVKVGGKDAATKKANLYSILNRSAEFGRAKKDTWGLSAWQGVSRKSDDDQNGKQESKKEPKEEKTTAE